jgi:hypothetical protein
MVPDLMKGGNDTFVLFFPRFAGSAIEHPEFPSLFRARYGRPRGAARVYTLRFTLCVRGVNIRVHPTFRRFGFPFVFMLLRLFFTLVGELHKQPCFSIFPGLRSVCIRLPGGQP